MLCSTIRGSTKCGAFFLACTDGLGSFESCGCTTARPWQNRTLISDNEFLFILFILNLHEQQARICGSLLCRGHCHISLLFPLCSLRAGPRRRGLSRELSSDDSNCHADELFMLCWVRLILFAFCSCSCSFLNAVLFLSFFLPPPARTFYLFTLDFY